MMKVEKYVQYDKYEFEVRKTYVILRLILPVMFALFIASQFTSEIGVLYFKIGGLGTGILIVLIIIFFIDLILTLSGLLSKMVVIFQNSIQIIFLLFSLLGDEFVDSSPLFILILYLPVIIYSIRIKHFKHKHGLD